MPIFRTGLGKHLDRNADPVKWNKAWDEYLEDYFQPRSKYPDMPALVQHQAHLILGQSFLAAVEQTGTELCRYQDQLAEFTAEKRAHDNFDAKWLKLSSKSRENYILQGLVISCGASSNVEQRREWCPETTMKYLQQDEGRRFLNLLTTICPHNYSDLQARAEPVFISHPVFDAIMRIGQPCKPGENEAASTAMQRCCMTNRNFFITFFLWNTMLHIYGESMTYSPTRIAGIRAIAVGNPRLSKQEQKEVEKITREARKFSQWHCRNCSIPENQLAEGTKFLECSRCRSVGLKVKYCNRECQMNDWKRGNPPHKPTCGKPFTIPDAVKTTEIQRAPSPSEEALEFASQGPPLTSPGSTLSNALLLQISTLQENLDLDYVLMEPDPKPNIGIALTDREISTYFGLCRSRAMEDGDPRFVAIMYRVLKSHADKTGFSEARLLLQLSVEYRVDVDTLTTLIKESEKGQV